MAKDSVKLEFVLAELDEKIVEGKQKTFSISYINKKGEFAYCKRAVACGLNMDMKKNAFRGILPVDAEGNSNKHPTLQCGSSLSILFYNQTILELK